ncbi:hypothetical protein C8R44DRAFT_822626 [Mycena epipterygia]|nr:hypothetical protein C8R44DRAFT_822626 [Mycena epipterygia]
MVLEVPLVPVSLATVALESCFYGAYFVLAGASVSLIVGRYSNPAGTVAKSIFFSPILLGAVGLFITITAHWILTVDRSFLAFLQFENGTFPLGFYGNLSQVTEVVKTGFLMATLTIGDALIIHRLWIVWGHNKYVIIFPMCTLLGLTVCGVAVTYQFSQYQPGQNVFLSEAGRWITSDTVFTLCTNLYSTTLISWRIWKSGRTIQPHSGRNLKSVLSILIESAALYTSWNLFFFVTYQSQSNLQFIVVDCWPAVTGISCMLIHVRVGLGWAQKGDQNSMGAASAQPFSVEINRSVHTNYGSEYRLDDLRGRRDKGDLV